MAVVIAAAVTGAFSVLVALLRRLSRQDERQHGDLRDRILDVHTAVEDGFNANARDHAEIRAEVRQIETRLDHHLEGDDA